MGKMRKNEKGITLVALVVTIIVLLILAGVSIASISGKNGVPEKAKKAATETSRANEIDTVNMILADAAAEWSINEDDIIQNIKDLLNDHMSLNESLIVKNLLENNASILSLGDDKKCKISLVQDSQKQNIYTLKISSNAIKDIEAIVVYDNDALGNKINYKEAGSKVTDSEKTNSITTNSAVTK